MRSKQQGLSLIGFILVGLLVAFTVMMGMKVVPSVIEYFTILRNVKQVASSSETANATVADIRKAYDKRVTIEYTSKIGGADLDITKDNGKVVISFAYTDKIPLFSNVSLVIDYQGSSSASE